MALNFKFLITFIFLIVLSSCGDLFTTSNDSVNSNQFAGASCLDTEAFARILDSDIQPEINCLQKSMNEFMNIVKTDRPGYLSKKTLNTFLLQDPNMDADIIHITDAVFDLSFLIFGGENGYISRSNVNSLTNFLKYFNSNIIQVSKRFREGVSIDYESHKREADVVATRVFFIANELKRILKLNRSGQVDEIELDKLINNFFKDDVEMLGKINSLMFLKRVFLGGEVYRMNHVEFDNALSKISHLAKISYNFVKAKNFNFSSQKDLMLDLYQEDIFIFKEQLEFHSDEDIVVFSIDNVFSAIEKLLPDFGIDLFNYRNEVLALKGPLVGNEGDKAWNKENNLSNFPSENFTSKQLHRLLDHVQILLFNGESIYRIYELNKEVLSSFDPVSRDFDFAEDQETADDFSRMVSNYKYIKGNQKSPIYDYKFNRNPDAFFEIAAIEYGLTQVMAYYGKADDRARGGYHMTYDETLAVIKKIRRFLRDQGIITIGRKGGNEIAGTADNLVLMSTLFQYQSDGCDSENVCMEVPELTEFVTGLLTAVSIKDFFVEKITNLCPTVDGDEVSKDNRRISVNCFRQNFMTVLKTKIDGEERSLADYMPRLTEYLDELSSDATDSNDLLTSKKLVAFIKETEDFTRTCSETYGQPLPMKPNDAFAVFAGLLNLESTFLRLDTNQNGVMDGLRKKNSEVLNAYYNVYQGAIKGLVAPNGGFAEKLAKPIFQYLIKYGTVPDTSQFSSVWQFFKFLIKFNKRSNASRMTIASILKTLGDQSETSKLYPFKCDECLHDPDMLCEPEDGAWE